MEAKKGTFPASGNPFVHAALRNRVGLVHSWSRTIELEPQLDK